MKIQFKLRSTTLNLLLLLTCMSCTSVLPEALYYTTQDQLNAQLMSAKLVEERQKLFHQTRKAWTRHKEVFNHFEGRLFVSATFISPAFDHVRTVYQHDTLDLTKGELAQLLNERAQQSQHGYWFLVTLSSSDNPKVQRPKHKASLNELIQGREDELRASLIIDDELFDLTKLDQLSFKRAQALSDDFPYISPVKTAYWLYFKVPEHWTHEQLKGSTRKVKLRFSSLPATTLLEWNIIFN